MKQYPLIDKMRIIAAILVICIHTSPLKQMNPMADLILTRIIARIAVPFFFITTSYFLFQDGNIQIYKVKKTIFLLLKWYILAIIVYIPVMLYNHYFTDQDLVLKLIKDIFIDGTFYHLWYFPAMIFGIIIVVILKKYLSMKYLLVVTSLLYLVGLCGDSYYHLVIHIPLIKDIFSFLFQFMDYTGNGLFFSPLFIVIGLMIAQRKSKLTFQANTLMLIISFLCMGVEAYLVHELAFCKHDSMYILLPFVSYYLFRFLICFEGQRNLYFKDLSLYIYILHPMMIIVVRMIGKLSDIDLLVNGYFIQFICVVVLTLFVSMLIERVVHDG